MSAHRIALAVLVLGVALVAGLRTWPARTLPSGTAQAQVRAFFPFVQRDPGGATLLCVSSQAGVPYPPFLRGGAPAPSAAYGPAGLLASGSGTGHIP